MAHVELLDPFGAVMAEGELTCRDVPGIDGLTPSVAEEYAQRFAGQRLTVANPEGFSPPGPYSVRFS